MQDPVARAEKRGEDCVYSTLRWKLYLNICIFTFCMEPSAEGRTGREMGHRVKNGGDIFQKITQHGRQWLCKLAHNIRPTITNNILTYARYVDETLTRPVSRSSLLPELL